MDSTPSGWSCSRINWHNYLSLSPVRGTFDPRRFGQVFLTALREKDIQELSQPHWGRGSLPQGRKIRVKRRGGKQQFDFGKLHIKAGDYFVTNSLNVWNWGLNVPIRRSGLFRYNGNTSCCISNALHGNLVDRNTKSGVLCGIKFLFSPLSGSIVSDKD